MTILKKGITQYTAFVLLTGIIFVLGCSTEKNTFTSRTYHNLTARYNVYFNGNEAYKSGKQQVKDAFEDNYAVILPIFRYGDEDFNSVAAADMDKAIDKASKLITKHSITARPERRGRARTERRKAFYDRDEYCNWVDDAYLLLGKANFYKQDFSNALQAFNYVKRRFEEQPIANEAQIWLIRSYLESGEYRKAKEQLDLLEGDDEFPFEEFETELRLLFADYYLKQDDYDYAIPHLDTAIQIIENKRFNFREKRESARYKFILAQIYQKQNKYIEAADLYREVIKMNPPYEMTFNAKINRARSFDVASGSSNEIKSELEKMLKDDKNYEFQDQIYYALAEIAYKENRFSDAMYFYNLSIQTSIDNQNQKALAYLALADIYFERPEYELAQAYYDSTITILYPEHPNFNDIKRKADNLTALVQNIQIVERQDSLQRWARMSETERKQRIDELIQMVIAEENRLAQQDQPPGFDPVFDNPRGAFSPNNQNQNTSGKWYFYNPASLSFGQSEFIKKWGNRKLEDNWRRKNKAITNTFEDGELAGDGAEDEDTLTTKDPEYYLKDLPETPEDFAASDKRKAQALFRIGEIYHLNLADYPKAIETLEDLNAKFPQHDYLLASYYNLYLLYKETGNAAKSDYYKNLIINEFPESRYAKILANPNYLQELEADKAVVEQIYESAYIAFENQNYGEVLNTCVRVERDYPDNLMMSKFLFLKALAVGAMNAPQTGQMKILLEELLTTYPDSKERQQAQVMLQTIEDGSEDGIYIGEEEVLYDFENRTDHFYVLVPKTEMVDVASLRFNISNFNKNYYADANYITSIATLGDKEVITVKTFSDRMEAEVYFTGLSNSSELLDGFRRNDFKHFLISADNYSILYQDLDVSTYLRFFNNHYFQ